MAIFSPIPGLEVTICVGNKPLQEYKNEDLEVGPGDTGVYQASVTSANFIEAPSGQEYAICLTLNNPTTLDCPAIGFEVFIDGISVLHLCIPASFYKGKEFKHHIYGIKSTQTDATKCTIRNFKFESIQSKELTLIIETKLTETSVRRFLLRIQECREPCQRYRGGYRPCPP